MSNRLEIIFLYQNEKKKKKQKKQKKEKLQNPFSIKDKFIYCILL